MKIVWYLVCRFCRKVNHSVTDEYFLNNQGVEMRCAYCHSVLYWEERKEERR